MFQSRAIVATSAPVAPTPRASIPAVCDYCVECRAVPHRLPLVSKLPDAMHALAQTLWHRASAGRA
eukprot:scaffold276_cov548-Prasinococcus_capsulatus_cf.AAC.23